MAASQTAPVASAPTPALDLSGYTRVVVVKTDDLGGHAYRRGSTHMADAATLAALKAKGMVAA